MARKVVKSDQCQNCGQALKGENYCSNCGQLNDIRKPTLWNFIGESLSNFFALDNKFVVSVYTLFRYPGKLAKEYVEGKRMKYMPPVRIYFISSILLLFFINLDQAPDTELESLSSGTNQDQQIEAIDTIQETKSDDDLSFQMNFADSKRGHMVGGMYRFASTHKTMSVMEALDSLNTPKTWLNVNIYGLALKLAKMDSEEFNRFISPKVFWILFLFLPLFAVWLKLFYLRGRKYYLEHLFFAFYTQSAFFLLFGFGNLFDIVFDSGIPSLISLILFGAYLFIALKNYYQQGIFKTFFKYILLNTAFFFFAFFFFAISLLVSFIVY